MKQAFKNLALKPWLYIIILLVGVSVKFYRLDYKIMWYDEIATVLQVKGADNILQIDSSKLNTIAPISHYNDLLKYDETQSSLGSEMKAQLKNMNLNPLHYMLLSFWYRVAGDSFVSFRLFSVLIFLLTLPFLFGLAYELFGSKKAGLIAISFFSISPFIHYFAQEARYYMLWVFLITAIHYFLIKAIHYKHNKWWAGYILFAVLSLYASILSGFILFEHLLFVVLLKKELRVKFLLILGIIGLIYVPWFSFVYANKNEVYSSLSWHKFDGVTYWAPLLGLVLGLVRTFSFYQNYTLFWDNVFDNITPAMKVETCFNVLILALIIVSSIVMWKKEKKETSYFVLLIIIPGLIFFWGLDLIRNAITTHWWRYYIFNTLPVILLATYLINKYIDMRKTLFVSIYIFLAGIGIYSIITISEYKYWYIGGEWEEEFVDNAELLSKAEKPLMITDFMWMNSPWEGPMHSMEILANCTSENIDVLRVSAQVRDLNRIIPEGYYSDIFVINASDSLLANLRQQYNEKLTILPGKQGPPRWRIER